MRGVGGSSLGFCGIRCLKAMGGKVTGRPRIWKKGLHQPPCQDNRNRRGGRRIRAASRPQSVDILGLVLVNVSPSGSSQLRIKAVGSQCPCGLGQGGRSYRNFLEGFSPHESHTGDSDASTILGMGHNWKSSSGLLPVGTFAISPPPL